MKLYKLPVNLNKTSQNIEYLDKLGVPDGHKQEVLDYLLSLDKDIRRKMLRYLRNYPKTSLPDLKELETDSRKDYLRNHGVPEEVVDLVTTISPKYSIWLAREVMNYFKQRGKKVSIPSFLANFSTESLKEMFDFVRAENPDLMKYSLEQMVVASNEWHEDLKNQDGDSTYATHDVVYRFKDGWEIVQLSSKDCEAEGELMGHCVGGYADQVGRNSTMVFSLRDGKNEPHATIEAYYDPRIVMNNPNFNLDNIPENSIHKDIDKMFVVRQIQGKENDEPIPEYKARLKEWFDSLKNKGFQFDLVDDPYTYSNITVKDFTDYDDYDEYGLYISFQGIGGDAETYTQNFQDAENEGWGGSYFYSRVSNEIADNLIDYATKRNELDELAKGLEKYEESLYTRFDEYEAESISQGVIPEYPEEPSQSDFVLNPDVSESQPEFGNEFDGTPMPDKASYEKAKAEYDEQMKAYEQARLDLEHSFEPLQFANYIYNELQKAKSKIEEKAEQPEKEMVEAMTTIQKTAQHVNSKDIPPPDTLALYVETLKLFLSEGGIKDKTISEMVKGIPSADKIKQDFSFEEGKILFETVAYAWEKITGNDLIAETSIQKGEKKPFGNYWIIKGGIVLHGVNHYSIIKQNLELFSRLLNINAFTLHEKMASPPNELIKLVLHNGGVRVFFTKNQIAYFQMSDDTYSEWGRQKVKKYDFLERIVRVIDKRRPYNGWKSGIAVKL